MSSGWRFRSTTDGTVPCTCPDRCGLTFERTRLTANRRYASGCPWYERDLTARKRASAARFHKRHHKQPLHCKCGCGLELDPGKRKRGQVFHPKCLTQAAKKYAHTHAPEKLGNAPCERCAALSWRRDKPVCRVCKEPHSDEPGLRLEDFTQRECAINGFRNAF